MRAADLPLPVSETPPRRRPPQAGGGRPSAAGSGNRCGHDPKRPRRFVAPAHHAPHPKLLERMHDASWGYYPKPKAVLPTLNAANGSERQQRSERREGCLSLLGRCCITRTW